MQNEIYQIKYSTQFWTLLLAFPLIRASQCTYLQGTFSSVVARYLEAGDFQLKQGLFSDLYLTPKLGTCAQTANEYPKELQLEMNAAG